jgi:hypothetical protein
MPASVIYEQLRWIFSQVVVVARKAFYSGILNRHERSRNIPPNCKTFSGALIGAAVNTLVAAWAALAVIIVGFGLVMFVVDATGAVVTSPAIGSERLGVGAPSRSNQKDCAYGGRPYAQGRFGYCPERARASSME